MQVLIVDDHPMMLEYLEGVACRAIEGAVVRTAKDLPTALSLATETIPELVLLDLGLPRMAGIEALLQFRALFPGPRVVIVSASVERRTIRGAFAAGAAGYVPKTATPPIVVGALRLVASGGKYVPPEALVDEVEQEPESVLTERQREVLRLLLRGRTVGQIARELGISAATSKHHAHAVYAAYRVSSRADLLVAANRRGSGLVKSA